MRMRTRFLDRQRSVKRQSVVVIAVLLFLDVWNAPSACAQERTNTATSASDLALQNLSRVAATAAEIKAVLAKDAGLMVELKHWVAQGCDRARTDRHRFGLDERRHLPPARNGPSISVHCHGSRPTIRVSRSETESGLGLRERARIIIAGASEMARAKSTTRRIGAGSSAGNPKSAG